MLGYERKYWPSTPLQERMAPRPTIRRLTFYLRALKRLQLEGTVVISCTKLKDILGFDATQIRKDLSVTGITGKPKVGYKVVELIPAIEAYLGWDVPRRAILVGVGSLGHALLGYSRLLEFAHLNIMAAFDRDQQMIGQHFNNVEVLDVKDMKKYIVDNKIEIGIISVPEHSASNIAKEMVEVGCKTLWNFAPCTLEVPDDVIVENVDMCITLAMLTTRMAKKSNYLNSIKLS